MRQNFFIYFLFGFTVLVGLQADDSHAAASGLLTATEQGLLLQSAGMNGERAAISQNQFLSDVERTIRQANPGMDSQSLRRPVSEAALRKLQMRSALRGNLISSKEISAATDLAQTLLRESPGESLASKVGKLPLSERKAIHGTVAELPEARERGGVLTKSRTSETWDITESKFQPRNYQMKIYAQHDRAISSILDDLDRKLDFNKRGILTKETLERGVQSGRLVREGNIYRPVGRSDIELEPSKAFSRPAESHLYAKAGRETLIKYGGLASEETAVTGFEVASKWMGRAGVVALGVTELYVFHEYATGRLSERKFITAQSSIVGGGLGAWGGASAGAWVGAGVGGTAGGVIGAWFGGVGAIPGAAIGTKIGGVVGGIFGGLAGGYGGAKLGEMAATGCYGHLDAAQKKQVEAFIYQLYGVTQ